jgi:hypothetical protein
VVVDAQAIQRALDEPGVDRAAPVGDRVVVNLPQQRDPVPRCAARDRRQPGGRQRVELQVEVRRGPPEYLGQLGRLVVLQQVLVDEPAQDRRRQPARLGGRPEWGQSLNSE